MSSHNAKSSAGSPMEDDLSSLKIVPDDGAETSVGSQDLDASDDLPMADDAPDEMEGSGGEVTFEIRKPLDKRLDAYLQFRLKGISRSKVQKLIESGAVTLNGKAAKSSTTIKVGDAIGVVLPAPAVRTIEPEPIPLDILYEDDDLIVVNKQANLIIHPARSYRSGTLVNALAHHFKLQIEARGGQWKVWTTTGFRQADVDRAALSPPSASNKPAPRNPGPYGTPKSSKPAFSEIGLEQLRPGIIHRLDKNTTGVIVVAKSELAHWQIAKQFEARTTLKAYLALVHGNFDQPSGRMQEPIGKHPTQREAYAVRRDSAGRSALTLFRVREQYRGYSLVELELKTGRTHQIRIHLAYLGHPIVGDILYGGEPIGERELTHPPIPAAHRPGLGFARSREQGLVLEQQARGRADLILASPALHAAFLRFHHPVLDREMIFTAPLHEPMATLVRQLRSSLSSDAPIVTQAQGAWADLSRLAP